MKTCTLCGKESVNEEDVKHLPLYVMGSEGILACLQCRIVLTRVAEGLKRVHEQVKLRTILQYTKGNKP